ncbi:YeeC-like protein [Oenococcus oeni]|uniref:GIY-YIG nuclease family protein n=1 Tax=Oenococcus oeni TaxID=1247 RepID=UPI0010B43561|nr:GIY-YIG nuclease family protein [Oenococcus oeni]SYW00390.1 YeeC-like protein [Oenococcus oeni]SYW07246.1 YeeC-like protein [Oenococcus oeni]
MNNLNPIRSLEDIFNDPDATNLLASKPKHHSVSSDPLVEGFQEIIKWVNDHDGQEPQKLRDPAQMQQRKLASRLKGIREDPKRYELLKPYDTIGLLKEQENLQRLDEVVQKEEKNFSSLDDILSDDSILFKKSDQQVAGSRLFDTDRLNEIKREQENKPEVISQRKAASDFGIYRNLFNKTQAEIASGQRQLLPFRNYELLPKHFYVLKGQLLYIDEIGEEVKLNDNSQRKTDARMHVVYDNGTENNPTRNGLAASLYGRQGRIVTDLEENFELKNEDRVTGYIYILETLSENPQIKKIQAEYPLYKVGFTTGSVQSRIANAANEPTYLYGPVRLVSELKVVNLKAETLETALHHALSPYQLNVDIKAGNGRIINPREWFTAKLDVIISTVQHIVAQLLEAN